MSSENKEVSANNSHLLLRPFSKSLIYIKNKKGPRTESCVTLAVYQPRINAGYSTPPFVFYWSRRNRLVYNQVSTYPVLTQFVKQSSKRDFIKRLLRYQGVTLELKGLHQKHLEFYD